MVTAHIMSEALKFNKVCAFILALILAAPVMGATSQQPLMGTWHFTEIIYRGVRQPRPNPALHLFWKFDENARETLHWDHSDGAGFCERTARFEVVDGTLLEEVLAVNYENDPSCSSDPDMQVGRVSANPIQIYSHEIQLSLSLGDEQIIYVLVPEELFQD